MKTKKTGYFWIYCLGTSNGKVIKAENMKSAKWIYALELGVNSIAYIAGKNVSPLRLSLMRWAAGHTDAEART